MLMKCIWLSRSDGTLETIGKNRIREPNEPTRDQLDRSPNAQGLADYYHLIEVGEDKEVEWRRKLGTLLQQYLGHLEQDSKLFTVDDKRIVVRCSYCFQRRHGF